MRQPFKWGRRLNMAKLPISLSVAASSVLGWIIRDLEPPFFSLILTTVALFLLSCGAGTLNNYQDRRFDALSSRTRKRPLPARDISPKQALIQAGLLIFLGMAGLYAASVSAPLVLMGAGALICYNGVYTPLKKRTWLAVFPGAICGALPPLMGWMGAGGDGLDMKIWGVMILFGVWQIPHFWLVGLASPHEHSHRQWPGPIPVFFWISLFAALMVAIPMGLFLFSAFFRILLIMNSALLLISSAWFFFLRPGEKKYRAVFQRLNLSIFLGMLLIAARAWAGP